MAVDRRALPLCVDLLGPLRLTVEGDEITVPGARRRALLALLALEGGRSIGVERLLDSLWPDGSPDSAVQALYSHVSRLRGHLGPLADRLERHGGGYRLRLEPHELDVDAARRLAAAAAAGGEPAAVAEVARAALALWRGPALEEFRALPALEAESVGLDELRLRLVDDLLEARLRGGERGVAVDAAAAAAASPLRERTALLHVRTLAAEGRSSEAMAAAQAFRRRLAEETGLDPGPALAALEQEIASGEVADRPLPAAETRVHPRRPARPDGPLVGRRHEREDLLRLMDSHAVVTLSGPGGVGKSRLAADVASDPLLDDIGDVVLVDLTAVDHPDQVVPAVASMLGLTGSGPVDPAGLADAVAERSMLLVLDNCEHLLDACRALVATLRVRAPRVRVLATSRAVLHVPEEYVVRLQPLPVPRDVTDLDSLRRQPAVRAFLEHAHRRAPGFELREEDTDHLVDVLRRLDGLPLGIELAARQVALMPLAEVRSRLDRALDLATGRPDAEDERQRTLRVTIESSYRLLPEEGQRLLRSFAVFPGGVDLPTVEALAADLGARSDPIDLLHGLVDASLVVADPRLGRCRLLFTVRSFLLDLLERAGELDSAEQRFLDRMLAVAREIGSQIFGPDEAAVDRRLRAEVDNLRAARDLAAHRGRQDVRVGMTLVLSEAMLWRDLREPWEWALELAEDAALADHPDHPALLGCAAEAARLTGDFAAVDRLAERSLQLGGDDAPLVFRALSARATVAHYRGHFADARRDWVRSGEGRPATSGNYLSSAALAASYAGDLDDARRLLEQARHAIAGTGSPSHVAFADYVEGELLAVRGRVEEAIGCYERAIAAARGVGATFVDGIASVSLAAARVRVGDLAGAADGFARLLELWRRTGQNTQLWTTARNAAGLLARAGRNRTAALLLLCAEDAPGAATVDPEIAARSTRVFTDLADLAEPDELDALRDEARRAGAAGVLDAALAELQLVAGREPGPRHRDVRVTAGLAPSRRLGS